MRWISRRNKFRVSSSAFGVRAAILSGNPTPTVPDHSNSNRERETRNPELETRNSKPELTYATRSRHRNCRRHGQERVSGRSQIARGANSEQGFAALRQTPGGGGFSWCRHWRAGFLVSRQGGEFPIQT